MLYALILIPAVFALLIAMAPARHSLVFAKVGSLILFFATLAAMMPFSFDWKDAAAYQMTGAIPFVPALGIELSVGVDSIALWLIALTALLCPLCVWGSQTAITTRVRTYYAWLMALHAAMIGVFAARDLVFFYICFEFTLVPMYVLINLWGSTNREKAATKFFLFTFTGSIIALAGLVYVAYQGYTRYGSWSFDIATMQQVAASMSMREQGWVLFALMAGFAVKVPLFPVHTWLPLAHTEAPTAGSVILAGVLLKLGTYAIFRFVLPFVPDALREYAPFIAVLAVIGILYAGLICWVQRDVKKLVAYSSVAHLGFCVLGMVAYNKAGNAGAVMYMINHGLSTGALFFCIGMMYERYHTRSLDEVGGLATKMPIWAFFMGYFAMASVGLPGLNGFVSEFLCLIGTFQSGAQGIGGTAGNLGPWYAAVAGTGMIVAAIYLLYMVGKIVLGPLKEPSGHGHHDDDAHALPADLTPREIGILGVLAVACLVLGVLPGPMLKSIDAPIEATLAAMGVVDAPAVALAPAELKEATP
ncbi:MAG: NADH-quinone oxidoreductase subunit M [Phycisphaerales bacterium]|nr:NADH-quinone oxidoreductase subunit M [Phycisphaerales bacterium]MCA9307169.1 NADH-quinone oxidoreductase subunit M [Phycisphaerales bacterium]